MFDDFIAIEDSFSLNNTNFVIYKMCELGAH